MKKLFIVAFLFQLTFHSFAIESIVGKWRGFIFGHVDDKDYFINANIKLVKDSAYIVDLRIFSKDYTGDFILKTTLKNKNKLYIDSFIKVNEFPIKYLHIEECFTGYFLLKTFQQKNTSLDLYRNPIFRNIDDFTKIDSAGDYIPNFECFTTVLIQSSKFDTTFLQAEKQTDSIISTKKNNTKDISKRKVVSSKEWTVTNKKITLEVWDNNKDDGDIISLKFNDTWILTNFLLKKEKYKIELELTYTNNQLLLFAENLGSIPPNTAAISIDDNKLIRTFILNSDMSKSETIKIILGKP